jgi:hypothetical protein
MGARANAPHNDQPVARSSQRRGARFVALASELHVPGDAQNFSTAAAAGLPMSILNICLIVVNDVHDKMVRRSRTARNQRLPQVENFLGRYLLRCSSRCSLSESR